MPEIWNRTKAYSEETPYCPNIWINLKGRQPNGIVEIGEEYEKIKIREEIIRKMMKLLGRRPFLIGGWSLVLVSVCLSLSQYLVSECQAADQVSLPVGIYSLTSRERSVPEAILKNRYVQGVVLRMPWQDIETKEGNYNWGYFDQEVKRAAQWGKKIILYVVSGGQNTPEGVMNLPGVEKFRFIDRNRYHKETFGKEVTIPVFWDRTFLEEKKRLIKAWGDRFSTDPNLVAVNISCANATTGDWNFPDQTQEEIREWRRVGYSPDKLIGACKELLDTTISSFPGKAVILMIGSIHIDKPPSLVAQSLVDYAYARYPGRIMARRANLSAKTPDPMKKGILHEGIWKILFDRRPCAGAQMLWFVTGDKTFRMNGKTPGDERGIFQTAVEIGLHYGVSYLEVYERDLLNPDFEDIIRDAATELARESR